MFIEGNGTWTLLVHRKAGRSIEVDRWLRGYGPLEMSDEGGAAPRVLRAEFAVLPDGWSELLRAVKVRFLQLAPTGLASLFYEDDDVAIPLLLRMMRRGAVAVHDRPSLGGRDSGGLTVSQYDVLSLAVGLGYYETPPRVDESGIATHLHISQVRVAELLKEGEASIVTSHVDSSMMTTMRDASFEPRREVEEKRARAGAERKPE